MSFSRAVSRLTPAASVLSGSAALLNSPRLLSVSLPTMQDETTPLSLTLKSWALGKLNHVAIAVPDLDNASRLYKDVLGADVSETVPLPEHGVYTVFVKLGNTKIELLHPYGDKSPIESFLKKHPDGGMHHICIEVDNIKEALKDLEGKIRPLNPEPKIGAHGKPVVFLHPKDCNGVLLELEES